MNSLSVMRWAALQLLLVAAVRPIQDLRSQRDAAFEELFRRYFAHYQKGAVRSMPGLLPHEIPIQYEFEVPKTMYDMKMTPQLLLMRGGISSPDFALGDAFQSDSPWWQVEVDGIGGKHHQVLQGLPEANSVVVRPHTVLNSSLPGDLVKYLHKLKVPDSVHKQSFQFTLGVPLDKIHQLLKRGPPAMRKRQVATADFCRSRQPSPCSSQYEGLLLLCQMVLEQAAKCSACGFPKRCQTPWLLRTHIGDLAKTLPRDERKALAEEVLQLLGLGDVQLYPKGIMDYLHFPEMAEISGMVTKRGDEGHVADEMPTQLDGLVNLAARMLQNREHVDTQLRNRPCHVNSVVGRPWRAPTAQQWLRGAQEGRDLMSDHDSAATKASLSSTLWRSMGSWRWSAQEPRIFLECRNPQSCLGIDQEKWKQLSYEQMLREAALMAHELEAERPTGAA